MVRSKIPFSSALLRWWKRESLSLLPLPQWVTRITASLDPKILGKAGYRLFLILPPSASFNSSIFLTLHQLLRPSRLPAAGWIQCLIPTPSPWHLPELGTEQAWRGVSECCWGRGKTALQQSITVRDKILFCMRTIPGLPPLAFIGRLSSPYSQKKKNKIFI